MQLPQTSWQLVTHYQTTNMQILTATHHQAPVTDVVGLLAHGKSLLSSNSLWLLFLLCHARGWNLNRNLWVTTEGIVWSWNLGVQG